MGVRGEGSCASGHVEVCARSGVVRWSPYSHRSSCTRRSDCSLHAATVASWHTASSSATHCLLGQGAESASTHSMRLHTDTPACAHTHTHTPTLLHAHVVSHHAHAHTRTRACTHVCPSAPPLSPALPEAATRPTALVPGAPPARAARLSELGARAGTRSRAPPPSCRDARGAGTNAPASDHLVSAPRSGGL